MFQLMREWILANRRRVRFCVGGGELTEKIEK